MALTVLDVICGPAFTGATILGGWSGLGKPVRAITVAEVPDAAHWLGGGEVVLSTGYFVRENPALFQDWVATLTDAGAACLAIKPQRFIGVIPANIVAEADRLGLPLVALPYTVSWPDLIRPVTEALIYAAEREGPAYMAQLTELLGGPAGFASVAQALADLIGNPVIVESATGPVLGLGIPAGGESFTPFLTELLSAGAPLRSHPNWAVEGEVRPWIERRWRLPPGGAGDRAVTERLLPLRAPGAVRGTLSVLLLRPVPDGVDLDEVLRCWAAAVSLAYERLERRRERPHSEAQTRLYELLTRQDARLPEGEWSRALNAPGVIISLAWSGGEGAGLTVEEQSTCEGVRARVVDRLLRELERWLAAFDPAGAALPNARGAYLLLHVPAADWAAYVARRLREARDLVQGLEPGGVFRAGVGDPARDVHGYRRSLEQADRALALAARGVGDDGVLRYRDAGVYRALGDLSDMRHARAFSDELLAGLVKADRERGTRLVSTLEAFFAHNGDLAKTARQMYLHPNTLRYRLRQVEKLTGLRLRNVGDLAQLYLAVQVARLGPM